MKKKLSSYVSVYKGRVAAGVVIKILGTVAELLLPLIMAYMIDDVAPQKNVTYIILLGAAMLVFALIAWGGNVAANRMASKVARNVTENIRNDLFAKSMNISCSQIDSVTLPSMVSRLSSDTYNVHNMIGMVQRMGIRAPIMLIGGVALTFLVEPVLALVLLATVPLLTVIVIIISSKGIVLYTGLQKAVDVMVRKVRDDYTGIRVIKALSTADRESEDFARINDNVVAKDTKAGVIMGLTNPLLNMLLNLAMTAVVIVGAYRVASGYGKVGQIIAFTSYFTIILNAVIAVSRIFVNISKGNASSKRIMEILNLPEDLIKLQLEEEVEEQEKAEEYLSFEHVNFGYKEGSITLTDINFSIKKGQSLGIIGATGSGKSTIVSLLLRFYDPDSGKIVLDGKDIREYDDKTLRKKLGVVLQSDFLMTSSVKDNIVFGRDDIDVGAVKKAAAFAEADGFISEKEEGYDHLLTARGSNFSGGQKQRLLIARALAGQPDILILDDSSSALDYKTDARLRKSLVENFKNTTIVLIAQRISSVRFADKILVLKDGRQAGFGSDDQLMKSCDEYVRMYRTQSDEGGDFDD